MTDAPEPVPSVLRHRPFVLYWVSRTCASTAWQIQAVAVGWQMYDITGHALDLGLVGLAEFAPLLLFILIAGPVADRFNRRTILQVCQTVEGLAATALAVATFTGVISKELMLMVVFILGSGRAFEAPTTQAIIPAIVPSRMLPQAMATSASSTQMATIAGPAIGGFLYAFSPTLVYAVCAGLFFIAATSLFLVQVQPIVTRAALTVRSLFAGIHYIRNSPIILGAMSLDLFAVLLGGAVALLPIYAKDILDVGPLGLGMLRGAPAIGALIVITILSRNVVRRHVGRVLFAGIAMFGIATTVFAVSTSFPLSLLALAVLGASDSISVVTRLTLVQLETVDEMRGRVSAVNSLFVGTSNALGAFRAGVMANWFGAVPSVLIGGIGTIVVAALWIRLFPSLYRVDGYPPPRVSPPAADPTRAEASA